MTFNARVRGLKQLQATLRTLPRKIETGAVRSSVRAGAGEIRDEVKRHAEYKSIKKAIAVQPRKKRGGRFRATVGIRTTGRNRAPHAHLIEFGTKERVQKTTGRRTGRMPARPYFEPAVEASQENAIQVFLKKVRSYILTKLGR
jgi:HK97 gp10 family phage protein